MPKQEKVQKVTEIKERLHAAQAAVFANYRGLSVPEIGEVRTALVDADAQFAVVKNTLAKLAVKDAGLEDLEPFIDGPTAIAFVKGDPVVGTKALVDAAKRFTVLEVRGGVAEGRILSAEEVQALAALDTREEMLAKTAGLLQVQMARAAWAFQALQSRFLALLEALKEKLPEGEATGEAPEEPPAEAPEEPAAEAPEEPAAEAPEEPAAEAPAAEEDSPGESEEEGSPEGQPAQTAEPAAEAPPEEQPEENQQAQASEHEQEKEGKEGA